VAVPAELATFFAAQNVAEHGPRLVGEHRLSFLGDLRFLDEGDLVASGLTKVEARRLVAAAAKLGASQRIVSDKPGGGARAGRAGRARSLGLRCRPTPHSTAARRNPPHLVPALRARRATRTDWPAPRGGSHSRPPSPYPPSHTKPAGALAGEE
jgi:hypothetical protein